MILDEWRARLKQRQAELAARQVLVLCGGGSHEREVSLRSGRAVFGALASAGYAAALTAMASDNLSIEAVESANLERLSAGNTSEGLKHGSQPAPESGSGLMATLHSGPVMVLSTMHGALGENGSWQGLLELLDVPYVSAGVKGSALGMDKLISKRLFEQLGIPTPPWWVEQQGESCRLQIPAELRQLVAKPVGEGSSVGVEMVDNDQAGWERIAELNRRFDPLLIEERVAGKEITCAVIGPSRRPLALPLIEIRPRSDFYSYEAKYTSGGSQYLCPAPLADDIAASVQRRAERIYQEFELGPYARIDCLVDESGQSWFLEANTLPGFTELSLLPMAASAAGISMAELLELLMLFALERWEGRAPKSTVGEEGR